MTNANSNVKKNFLYNSAYQLLILIVPLVMTPYLTRTLGAEGIGQYTYAYSIAYYFVLFSRLGLNEYGNRTIAAVRDNQEELAKNFWSIYGMQVVTSVICIVLYILMWWFASRTSMTLILLFYVISGMFDVNWAFFGMEKFKLTVLRNTAMKVASTLLIFFLVKTEKDVLIYGTIMSVGFLASQLVLWPYLKNEIGFYKPSAKEILQHVKPNLVMFIPTVAVSLYKIMDKVMLGAMSSIVQVGYYESAEQVINVPIALIRALGTVMLPRMSNLAAQGKTHQVKESIFDSVLIVGFLSTSMCFGILGVAEEFVPAFFGVGFEPCLGLFRLLIPSCFFVAFSNVVRTQYLVPMHRDRVFVTSVCTGAVVNLAINALMIPTHGAQGAAFGTLIAEFVVFFIQFAAVRRELPVFRYLKDCIPMFVAGGVMFLMISQLPFVESLWMTIVLKVGMGAVVYFFILFIQLAILSRTGNTVLLSSVRKFIKGKE